MAPTKIGLYFTLRVALFVIILDLASTFQSCPSICTCKWKNGKTQFNLTFFDLPKVWVRKKQHTPYFHFYHITNNVYPTEIMIPQIIPFKTFHFDPYFYML